ncbi:hypothetical protein FA95DRAFT_1567060 [Auriscalpium vulgare]|uniref:Uncharacterized protein n=1 Tax=Auriscalpium vulgare TaxID=40419 RepID=A0ACB8R7L4_9AGAM|nr:hypothetical protein FA95DRAFT_1567060 [Auriscalpium vulgare]
MTHFRVRQTHRSQSLTVRFVPLPTPTLPPPSPTTSDSASTTLHSAHAVLRKKKSDRDLRARYMRDGISPERAYA